jgi:hypothetical protein
LKNEREKVKYKIIVFTFLAAFSVLMRVMFHVLYVVNLPQEKNDNLATLEPHFEKKTHIF